MFPDFSHGVTPEQVNMATMVAMAVISTAGAALTTLVFPFFKMLQGVNQATPYDMVSKACRVALSVALQAAREGEVAWTAHPENQLPSGKSKPVSSEVVALWLGRGVTAGFSFLQAQGALDGVVKAYNGREAVEAALTAYILANSVGFIPGAPSAKPA